LSVSGGVIVLLQGTSTPFTDGIADASWNKYGDK